MHISRENLSPNAQQQCLTEGMYVHVQSLNSQASLFRQSTQRRTTGEPPTNDLQEMAADLGTGDDIQTVMWTRELAKRLLLPRADIEALEDLLDTYFMQAQSHALDFPEKKPLKHISGFRCS